MEENKTTEMKRIPIANSIFPKGRVSCFTETFMLAEGQVLQIKLSAKNPSLRIAAKPLITIYQIS
jgi:hypothetical protein